MEDTDLISTIYMVRLDLGSVKKMYKKNIEKAWRAFVFNPPIVNSL